MNKSSSFIKIIFLFFSLFCQNLAHAKELSSSKNIFKDLNLNIDNLVEIGNYHLSFMGLKIYFIQLFSDKNKFSYENKLALVINYERKFAKDKLIERSINEIKKNYILKEDTVEYYKKELAKIFTDVNKGDIKIAYFDPKKGLKLFYNGKEMGELKDLVFAKRFMDIWLHSKSSFPKMTKSLINSNEN